MNWRVACTLAAVRLIYSCLFLRAERRPDGVRTFRMKASPPQPTSHGEDSFRRVFGVSAHAPIGRAQYG